MYILTYSNVTAKNACVMSICAERASFNDMSPGDDVSFGVMAYLLQ
jgi:hypothetical protein